MEEFVPVFDPRTFGQYVTLIRGSMSQAAFGSATGLSREQVSQIETGKGRKRAPDMEVLNRMAVTASRPLAEVLRAAGASIQEEEGRNETLDYLISQLDDDGLEQLAQIALVLLPRHRRRPGTREP